MKVLLGAMTYLADLSLEYMNVNYTKLFTFGAGMTLLIDNYDSFTNNLFDYLSQLNQKTIVIKNDELSIEEIRQLNFDNILLSPGPKTPIEAGVTMDVIHAFHNSKPILGICLGHQAIGLYFGAEVKKAQKPIHGYTSLIDLSSHSLFDGIASPMQAMRYHSLIVDCLPETLISLAQTSIGEHMIIAHQTLPIVGIQFHPESILTSDGIILLKNWFNSLGRS